MEGRGRPLRSRECLGEGDAQTVERASSVKGLRMREVEICEEEGRDRRRKREGGPTERR